jgi:hypothetical protein
MLGCEDISAPLEIPLFHIGNQDKLRLERATGGADEVAKDRYVGAVDTDAASVHGEAEQLGLFEIHAGVIEFGEAEALRGQNAV